MNKDNFIKEYKYFLKEKGFHEIETLKYIKERALDNGYKPYKGKYQACCNNGDKIMYLGVYPTKEEAFNKYKPYKENLIKKVIDKYEGKIPSNQYEKLHKAMYDYEVEITD